MSLFDVRRLCYVMPRCARRRKALAAQWLVPAVGERLEARQYLSATAGGVCEPVAGEVAVETVPHQGRRRNGIDLSGDWSIRTEAGPLRLQTEQRGKRIKGKVDLADADLTSLLQLPVPLPIPIEIPPVTFKGKFKQLTLDVDFETQINLPIIGTPLFAVTGNITARVDILSMSLVGHLTVNVNGNQVLSTDFTSPLPGLP